MEDPVIDTDGNTYERSAIELWLKIKGKSPITKHVMDASTLRPNLMAKRLIEEEKKKKMLPPRLPGNGKLSQLK